MATVSFYTMERHVNISTSASDANAIDNNLDTNWNSGTIEIDTGSTGSTVDAYGIWIRNYNTNHSSKSISFYSSNNGSSWTYRGSSNVAHGGGPLYFHSASSSTTSRYFRFSISSGIEIGQVFLLHKHTITTSPEYPLKIYPKFYNDEIKMRGGRKHIAAQALNNTYVIDAGFTFISTANKTAFENFFLESHGGLLPLIYQPGSSVTDAYLCRATKDTLKIQERYNEYYKASIALETLPYIADGDNF